MKQKEKLSALEQARNSIKKEIIAFSALPFESRSVEARDALSRITGTMLWLEETLGSNELEAAWEGRK